MRKRVLVGLSGGVDSAVSAYLLKSQGYDVVAGFMINYLAPKGEHCPTLEDIEEAKRVAKHLDIPFFTFDFREEYEQKVLNYMYDGYKKGITPNPDIMCNSEVKFKIFLEESLEHGFDKVATGHYAIISEDNNGIFHLKKGLDKNKDQSYFLSGLSQYQLSKSIFPIGNMEKSEVRKIANDIGLPNANRPDSQGICFVGKVNLTKFLEKKISPKIGNIVDSKGNILGKHKGVFYYTIGQRKGLDLGGQPKPVFVINKNLEKNEIVVGDESDFNLYGKELEIKNINFLSSSDFDFPLSASAKIRYRQDDQKCIIHKLENDLYKVFFDKEQRAISPGQICSIYLENELIFSGVIQ